MYFSGDLVAFISYLYSTFSVSSNSVFNFFNSFNICCIFKFLNVFKRLLERLSYWSWSIWLTSINGFLVFFNKGHAITDVQHRNSIFCANCKTKFDVYLRVWFNSIDIQISQRIILVLHSLLCLNKATKLKYQTDYVYCKQ